MGRAESRPRERQSRRLSFGLRCVAGASSLPFLSRLPRAAALALPLLAAAVLVPAGEARAQTTVTLVSNTGQTVSGNVGIVYLVAQGFRTGGKIAGYNLASVGIALGNLGFDSNTVTVRPWPGARMCASPASAASAPEGVPPVPGAIRGPGRA